MNEKLKKSIVEASYPFKKESDDNRNETEDGTATVPFHEECDGNQAGSCQPHAGISLPPTPPSSPFPDDQHHNNDSLPLPSPGAVAVRGIGEDGMGWMPGDSTMSASATMQAPSTVTNSSTTADTDPSTRIRQESASATAPTSGGNNTSQQLVEVAVAVELAEDIEEENEELKRSLEVERKQRQRMESLVSHAVTVNGEEVPNSTNTNADVNSSMKRCNNNTMAVSSLILLLLGWVAIVLGVTFSDDGDVESPPPPMSAPTSTTGSSLHQNKTIAPSWSCTCKDLVGSFLTLQLWDVVDPVALSSETALTIFDELFGRDEWVSNHGFQEHMGAKVIASGETTPEESFGVNSSHNGTTIMLMNIFQSNTSLNFVEVASLSFTSDKPSLTENAAFSSNATGEFLKCKIAFQISNKDCSIPLSNIDEYYLRISHWKLSLNNKEDFWSQMVPASIVNHVDWYDHDCYNYYCSYEEGIFGFPHSSVVEYFGCQQYGTDDVFFFSVTSDDVDFASKEGPFLRQISGNRIEEVGSVVGAISFDHTCVKETLEFCVDNSCESDQDCAGIDSVCVFDSCAEGLGKVSEHCPCLEDSDCEQGACVSPIFKCVGVESEEPGDSASRTGCANHAVYSFLFLGLLGFLI